MKGPRAPAQYANCYTETTFLFYLFTQARHIKPRLSLAAIQPAVGRKPFPLINAGNPEARNIFCLTSKVASQTIFMMNPEYIPPSLHPSRTTWGRKLPLARGAEPRRSFRTTRTGVEQARGVRTRLSVEMWSC